MTIPGPRGSGEPGCDGGCCKLKIPFHEKIFVVDVFQDLTQSLVAVGLRSSVVIVELFPDDVAEAAASMRHQVLLRIDHDSRVQSFSWSPETCLTSAPKCLKFATGGSDHHLRLYSSDLGSGGDDDEEDEGGGCCDTLKVLKGHTDYVNAIAHQPENGDQIASGSDDHSVILWNATSGRRLENISFKSPVMALNWHPDEVSKLMVAEKSGVLHIFNVVSYHPILSLDCGAGPLLSADWSLYNNLLLAAAVRSEVIVWDLSKMAPVSRKHMRQDVVKSVKMCPSSEFLLATAGQPNYSVKISNFNNSHLADLPPIRGLPVGGISWHPRKSLLVVGHDQTVSVHQVSNKAAQ